MQDWVRAKKMALAGEDEILRCPFAAPSLRSGQGSGLRLTQDDTVDEELVAHPDPWPGEDEILRGVAPGRYLRLMPIGHPKGWPLDESGSLPPGRVLTTTTRLRRLARPSHGSRSPMYRGYLSPRQGARECLCYVSLQVISFQSLRVGLLPRTRARGG
jgi:hypothetical protein